jgi:hypothetical protein
MHEQQAAAAEKSNKQLEERFRARLAESEATIAKARQDGMTHITEIAAEVAKDIVERLIGISPNAKEIASALREAPKRPEGSDT